jgi:hypothetical protein
MPRWCLNNCKGRKFYCVTICLAVCPLICWNFAQNMDYCPYPGHQRACMWHRHTEHLWDQWRLHMRKFWAQENSNYEKHCHSKTELSSIFCGCSRTKYRQTQHNICPLNVFPVECLLVFNI